MVVVPPIPLIAADIVAEPTPVPVASPEPSTIVIVGPDDPQVALSKACVVPSLKLPVAVNCCVLPKARLELAGESVIDVRLALVTVTGIVVEADPSVAVIVDCPGVNPETIPVWKPTVATLGAEEDQFTIVVMS